VIDVRQFAVDGTDEAWERVTGEPDVRGVEAGRIDFAGGWNVTVAVMEFVREDPLESEFRRRIAAALRSVGGVETAEEMDRECGSSPEPPPAMPWCGLRRKSWTTSPARHARMPEAKGGAHPLPGGRVSVPGHPGGSRCRTHEQRLRRSGDAVTFDERSLLASKTRSWCFRVPGGGWSCVPGEPPPPRPVPLTPE
jgi:hypothetical protein